MGFFRNLFSSVIIYAKCDKIDIVSNKHKTTDTSLSLNTDIVMATINTGQLFTQLDTGSFHKYAKYVKQNMPTNSL